NVGEAAATNVDCNIGITGGLFIIPKEFTGNQATLGVGQTVSILCKPKGIGLGLLKPIPSIQMDVTCDEGISATKTSTAKIFFSNVKIQ
ncbi:MAG: hypothetical protein WC525_05450, partial [Candidatus Thermoplasmatota archaeon]